jgi:glucose-1-phosphate cytidylyltransferase
MLASLKDKTPIFILCGGLGTRMKEETEFMPKPMVVVGGEPILIHIMKSYALHGFTNFVLCLGFKSDYVKKYFLTRRYLANDFLIDADKEPEILSSVAKDNWKIRLIDTGDDSMTGCRIARAFDCYDDDFDHFGVTYGDGLCNLNITEEFRFHLDHGSIGTITGVNPISRFGQIAADGNTVQKFMEKPILTDEWINGGYFFFKKEFRSYLSDESTCVLEREPLVSLTDDRCLRVYRHSEFWRCMDTQRDKEELDGMFSEGKIKWLTT